MSRTLPVRLGAGFAAALLLAGAAIWLTLASAKQRREAALAVVHTLNVIAEIRETLQVATDVGRVLRGYLLTGQSALQPDLGLAWSALREQVAQLRQLTAEEPLSSEMLLQLGAQVDTYLEFQEQVLASAAAEGLEAARQLFATGEGTRRYEALRETLGEIAEIEETLLRQEQAENERADRQSLATLAVVAALLLGVLGGSFLLVRHHLAERLRAEAAVREANAGLEERVRVRTAELEGANRELVASSRVQQELADALALEQRKLATAFDHMETGVVLSDARGGGMTMNPAALKILGFASVAEVHERVQEYEAEWEIRDAAGHVLPFAEWPLPRAVAGHYYRDLEFWLRHLSSGHETVCSFTGVPVRDAAGEVVQVLLTLHDVTGRKRAEAEILALNAELEHKVDERTRELVAANRELDAFAYSVSHDLRAPLRHVNGFVELVERTQAERLDDTGRRYFRVIAEAAAKMGRLIDDLLAFSRVGRIEVKRERVKLGALVEETRRALEPEAAGRQVDWRIAPLPEVAGDPALLRQVFANLLGNALKYSRHRTPAVVEVALCESGAGETVVRVRDNGVGFDMQYVDQLFGVFRRLHRDEEFEGTGVGLALVRRIVERHGGRVWAEGRPGEGAAFFVALPSGAPDAGRSPAAP